MCIWLGCHFSYIRRSIDSRTLTKFLLSPGNTRFGPVDYSGTLFVKDGDASHYIGVVFGYQSNRKFYVAMWRRENINYGDLNINAGIKGLQIKVISPQSRAFPCSRSKVLTWHCSPQLVNSTSGPGSALAEALWHSGDTTDQESTVFKLKLTFILVSVHWFWKSLSASRVPINIQRCHSLTITPLPLYMLLTVTLTVTFSYCTHETHESLNSPDRLTKLVQDSQYFFFFGLLGVAAVRTCWNIQYTKQRIPSLAVSVWPGGEQISGWGDNFFCWNSAGQSGLSRDILCYYTK